jgi:hypothetical protein
VQRPKGGAVCAVYKPLGRTGEHRGGGNQARGGMSQPNPYEDPSCQETTDPLRAVFCVFSAFQGLAQAADGCVF